ncbi:hypothetical protein D3C76_1202870 [compost metagenome]
MSRVGLGLLLLQLAAHVVQAGLHRLDVVTARGHIVQRAHRAFLHQVAQRFDSCIHRAVEVGDDRIVIAVGTERLGLVRGQLGHVYAWLVDDTGLQEFAEGSALLGFIVAAGSEGERQCKGKQPLGAERDVHVGESPEGKVSTTRH